MRDPGVSVKTLLLHPKLGLGGGEGYIRQFPSKEEILDFDVIFMGDVGFSSDELSEEQLALIEGLVRHHGSGLVLLPGRRGRHISLMKSPVSEAYPVILDDTMPQGVSSGLPSAMELSSEGREHFLTMLADTPKANAEVWRSLPGFSWNAAVKRTLPGSNVIAIHSGLRLGASRMPILVTREHGNGNVLFMGIDSAWRWRKGVEDKYHYRFWGQVVRWMAHKRHIAKDAGIRCFFIPEAPRVGGTVFLHASVYDRLNQPIENAEVDVSVMPEEPGDAAAEFRLFADKGEWGVYRGSFAATTPGVHTVTLRCPQNNAELSFKIDVAGKTLERQGQPVNIRALEEIARITKGKLFMTNEMDKLAEHISALPRRTQIHRRLPLWCQWWWAGAIIALLASHWTLRKLFGLL